MIDLSEQFYSHIKIYGSHYDQLKPILNMKNIREIIHVVMKLKSVVSAMESLFLSFHSNSNIHQWNSLDSLFRWRCRILTNKEEIDLICSYLYGPQHADHDCLNHYEFFKFNHCVDWNTNKSCKTYLLWCHLKSYEFLSFFFGGFDGQTFLLHSDLPIIMNVYY